MSVCVRVARPNNLISSEDNQIDLLLSKVDIFEQTQIGVLSMDFQIFLVLLKYCFSQKFHDFIVIDINYKLSEFIRCARFW